MSSEPIGRLSVSDPVRRGLIRPAAAASRSTIALGALRLDPFGRQGARLSNLESERLVGFTEGFIATYHSTSARTVAARDGVERCALPHGSDDAQVRASTSPGARAAGFPERNHVKPLAGRLERQYRSLGGPLGSFQFA